VALAATIAADIAGVWEVVKKEGAYITNKKTGVVQVHPVRPHTLPAATCRALPTASTCAGIIEWGVSKPKCLASGFQDIFATKSV
jgi:hypothetical protein